MPHFTCEACKSTRTGHKRRPPAANRSQAPKGHKRPLPQRDFCNDRVYLERQGATRRCGEGRDAVTRVPFGDGTWYAGMQGGGDHL